VWESLKNLLSPAVAVRKELIKKADKEHCMPKKKGGRKSEAVPGEKKRKLAKKITLSAVMALVGFAVIAWIVIQAGAPDILKAMAGANRDVIALAALTIPVWLFFRSLRWQNILASAKIPVRISLLYQITSVGILIDFITPIYRAGSEPVRTFMLEKYAGVKTGKGLATVILDRVFDFSVYISLSIFALILLFNRVPLSLQVVMLLSVAGLVAMLFYIVYLSIRGDKAYRTARRAVLFLKRFKFLRPRMKAAEKKLKEEVAIYSTTVREGFYLNTVLNAIISIVLIGLEVMRLQLLLLALGYNISLLSIIIAFGAVILAGIVPSPPGGVGLVEPVGIGAFLMGGLTLAQATTLILIDRLVMTGIVALIGIASSIRLGKRRAIKPTAFRPRGAIV